MPTIKGVFSHLSLFQLLIKVNIILRLGKSVFIFYFIIKTLYI